MARVKFSPNELDQNYQIEDGIRETLRKSSTAEVSALVIEKSYDLLDNKCDVVPGTLQEKCDAIAQKLKAEYSTAGENIVFRAALKKADPT